MFSKKGGVAVEELRGMLTYVLVAVIAMLVFYGCNVLKAKESKKDYETLDFEDNAVRDLNNFLEMRAGEGKDVYSVIGEAYSKNDFSMVDALAKSYFSGKYTKWRLLIADEQRKVLYNSIKFEAQPGTAVAVSEAKVPVYMDGKAAFLSAKLELQK